MKVLIAIAIILLIVAIIRIVYKVGPFEKHPKVDFLKAFTLQKESKEPLAGIRTEIFEVKYINKSGAIDTRKVKLFIPENRGEKLPLVYVPHYELAEDAEELRVYTKRGWAVASTAEFKNDYNKVLSDDDLVFNNAALMHLRNRADIDGQRIIIKGGSAGGYMALMLGGLQMGNCAVIAESPITNVYFNFHQYFPKAEKINGHALGKMAVIFLWYFLILGDKIEVALKKAMLSIPMPFPGMVSGMFTPINDCIAAEDYAKWEALSPIGLSKDYSSPFFLMHYTSDILVPIDQISREYSYPNEGKTMPEGFSTKLDKDNPGILDQSFIDLLPKGSTMAVKEDVTNLKGPKAKIPYDLEYRYNFLIIDEGETQAFASHDLGQNTVDLDIASYMAEMMDKTLKNTEILLPDKLLLLLERYQGKSMQLPAHEGIDDTVYGSLAIYKKEIEDELKMWISNHSLEEMEDAMQKAMNGISDETEQDEFKKAWKEIRNKL